MKLKYYTIELILKSKLKLQKTKITQPLKKTKIAFFIQHIQIVGQLIILFQNFHEQVSSHKIIKTKENINCLYNKKIYLTRFIKDHCDNSDI